MKCNNCGAEVSDNAKFCGECGASIENKITKTSQITTPKQPKKKKGLVVALVVILIAVIIAVALAFAVVYFKNNSADIDNPEIENIMMDKDYDEDNEIEINADAEDTVDSYIDEEPDNSDYLFPSDKEYITENDLRSLTKEEVALIRNEIYARHGYMFQTEPYKSYFAEKEWYTPNANFNESMFNVVEESNKDFIAKYEQKMGWR
jgi:uncharacterized membrane protein YvbJ